LILLDRFPATRTKKLNSRGRWGGLDGCNLLGQVREKRATAKTVKNNRKHLIYFGLNLVLILVLLWSLMIYTSLFKGIPWYEPCGSQFLAILIISDPIFLVTGIALLILAKHYPISKLNKWLPFITIVGLSLPILIDGSLSKTTLLTGTAIGVMLLLLIIVAVVKRLVSSKIRTC
jgi:hypothetical protein